KRNEFLNKRSLDVIPAINIADEDSVFNSLDETSFDRWNDKVALLPGIFDAVLKDAISELQPKTKYYKLNKPLLETEDDLQKWLADVERELRSELENGPVV
ncbi:hypothetical protein, partial [Vibrio anguillarum]